MTDRDLTPDPLRDARYGVASAASLGVFRPPGATGLDDDGGWQGLFDQLKGSTTFWVIAGLVIFVALIALVRGGR